jgi:predicted DNA-binding protein (MmcQ/YjbR family)
MSFAALKKHAAGLPAATVDLKWQVDWVASVGGRMFFVGGPEPRWSRVAFKVEEHRFLELTGLPGIVPAPYLARAKWVQVQDMAALPLAHLKALVERSHALVASRLTRAQRRELGLEAT